MAEIVAKRLVEHLERAGFVVMKRPADLGAATFGRGRGLISPKRAGSTITQFRVAPQSHPPICRPCPYRAGSRRNFPSWSGKRRPAPTGCTRSSSTAFGWPLGWNAARSNSSPEKELPAWPKTRVSCIKVREANENSSVGAGNSPFGLGAPVRSELVAEEVSALHAPRGFFTALLHSSEKKKPRFHLVIASYASPLCSGTQA